MLIRSNSLYQLLNDDDASQEPIPWEQKLKKIKIYLKLFLNIRVFLDEYENSDDESVEEDFVEIDPRVKGRRFSKLKGAFECPICMQDYDEVKILKYAQLKLVLILKFL
jgi:hypothetical protein